MSILDFWALPDNKPPRDGQIEALEWLENSDKKYLILEAPVGGGKSGIALTYSRYLSQGKIHPGESFILTPQIILQKQYENDEYAPDMSINSLYGKSNYQCESVNSSCEIGMLATKGGCKCCPYKQARTKAKKASHTILNYKLALLHFSKTDVFDPRKLMVLDEAHKLESFLVEFDKITISASFCTKHQLPFRTHDNIADALMWQMEHLKPRLDDLSLVMCDRIETLKEQPSLSDDDTKELKEAIYIAELSLSFNQLFTMDFDKINTTFVYSTNTDKSFAYSRLTGAYAFKNILTPMAEKFLFMSGTIVDVDGFCRDLGIPRDETDILKLDSTFPVDNRPVYYKPVMSMNASWNSFERADERDSLIDALNEIVTRHKDESGVIHTGNFRLADWFEQNITPPQMIFSHGPQSDVKRNDAIRSFLEHHNPALLVSPSSTEGLDLKGELGTFAIFLKVPFLYLGDQWVRRRMELSNEWYQRQAVIDIMQGCGRIVRSETDQGVVYILDGNFTRLYNSMKGKFPKWWKDAFTQIR